MTAPTPLLADLLRDIRAAHHSGDAGQLNHAVFMAKTHGVDQHDIDSLLEEVNAR